MPVERYEERHYRPVSNLDGPGTPPPRIGVSPWEPGDWVVVVDGRPVGETLSTPREAQRMADWLKTAIAEIRREASVVKP